MSVGQVEGVDPMTLIIWKQAMMLNQWLWMLPKGM
jgi:hypothetical protein